MNPLLTDSRRQALRSASHWYAVLSGEARQPTTGSALATVV